MESQIKRYKRSHKTIYKGDKFKNQMNISNFQKKMYNPLECELRCEIIKRSSFSKKLITLPKEIQIKIYRHALNMYWKKDIINRPLKPLWCDYKQYLDNEIKRCIIDNVHFLHLDFNKLPEYKKWIPGCQCEYCSKIHKIKKDEYRILEKDNEYFYKIISCNDHMENKWNQWILRHDSWGEGSIRIFDYLRGGVHTIYDQLKLSPNEFPIHFSVYIQ